MEGAFRVTLAWIPSLGALTSGVTFGNLYRLAKRQRLHVLVGEDVTYGIGLLRDNQSRGFRRIKLDSWNIHGHLINLGFPGFGEGKGYSAVWEAWLHP